jgi:hypothetical protein
VIGDGEKVHGIASVAALGGLLSDAHVAAAEIERSTPATPSTPSTPSPASNGAPADDGEPQA